MPRITPNQVALGVGSSGAMVDVSSYVSLGQGLSYDWGREDEFRDVTPSVVSFTLDNADGRFTPGNLSGTVLRTNLVTNPSFETGLTNVGVFSGATTTIDATTAQSGSQSVKVVTPGSVAQEGMFVQTTAPMSTGPLYSCGIWVKVPASVSMNMFFRYNGSPTGQQIVPFIGTGAWQFVSFNGNPSAGITITSSQIYVRTAGTSAITYWVDAAIIEQAPVIGTYFDGSTTDGSYTYGWSSTANASTSTQSVPVWPLTEGMPASWLLGTRLVSGSIFSLAPAFPSDQPAWSQIAVTVDDMLGNASRKSLANLADDINVAAGQYAMWPMDEDLTQVVAHERTSSGLGSLFLQFASGVATPNPATFGVAAIPGLPGTQMRLEANAEVDYFGSQDIRVTNFPYSQASMGFWGYWVTYQPNAYATVQVEFTGITHFLQLGIFGSTITMNAGSNSASYILPAPARGKYYIAVGLSTSFGSGVWTIDCELYVNGVAVAGTTFADASPITSLTHADRQPMFLRFSYGDGVQDSVTIISRLSHTANLAHEELAVGSTEALRLQAIDATIPEMVLDTLPADLSLEQIGFEAQSVQAAGFSTAASAALDAINDVMRTEQGYVWTATTGSLLAPVQKVKVRARNRPTAVTASFNVARELMGSPNFVRDITNMVSTIGVQGSDFAVTVTDPTINARAGSSSNAETVLDFWPQELTAFGQDRLIRGKNVAMRIQSVLIDAFNTPTDRSADLLSLKPGDRVQFTNLPPNQLGFTTWDGWLLGGRETHSLTSHAFQLFFAPVLSQPIPVFDTDRFSAGGMLSLTSSITSGATTMSVSSLDGITKLALTGAGTPYTLLIDSEQVTVTACTSATPQVATITRGVNGTTAAAHSAAALVDIPNPAVFAF